MTEYNRPPIRAKTCGEVFTVPLVIQCAPTDGLQELRIEDALLLSIPSEDITSSSMATSRPFPVDLGPVCFVGPRCAASTIAVGLFLYIAEPEACRGHVRGLLSWTKVGRAGHSLDNTQQEVAISEAC